MRETKRIEDPFLSRLWLWLWRWALSMSDLVPARRVGAMSGDGHEAK